MSKKIHFSFEEIQNIALQCLSRTDFTKNYSGAHKYAKEKGWLSEIHKIIPLLRKRPNDNYFDLENIKNIASKYSSKIHFIKEHKNLYQKAQKNNWLDEIFSHLSKLTHKNSVNVTFELAKLIALKFKTRTEFRKNEYHIYYMSIKNGWIDGICLHMKTENKKHSFENIKLVASQFKTRTQFSSKEAWAYNIAMQNDWLDNVCEHMITKRYSTPQLILSYILEKLLNEKISYNNRKVIKPYELDIYFEKFNLAFEFDGVYWHTNYSKNDLLKDKLCFEKNINLFRILELSTNYEKDIKNQLIKIIKQLNVITNLKITKKLIKSIKLDYNIIYKNVLDVNDIEKIISNYTTLAEFKKHEPNLYSNLERKKLLKKFTSNLIKQDFRWTDELIILEVSKYIYLSDFILKSRKCYDIVNLYKKHYLIKHLIRKRQIWTDELIISEISKYATLNDFMLKSRACFTYVSRHKKHLLSKLKRKYKQRIKWTIELLMEEIDKYSSKKEFREKSRTCYAYVCKHNKELLKIYNK